MFKKTDEELTLTGIDDFIENPSHSLRPEELTLGVNKILYVLEKNPQEIMRIISGHAYIPTSFMLENLAEKMKNAECLEKLALLFDKCLDTLVEACTYNHHDLKRCTDALPTYTNKVIDNALTHEHLFKRMLEADNEPKEALTEITKYYPQYKDSFSEFYNKHYEATSYLKKNK